MSRSGYEKMVERDVEGKGLVLLLDPAKGTPLSQAIDGSGKGGEG
jgi:hypothetical protein